jgi:3-oxoacyl-[acyl-carrier protein] reductase
MLLAGRSAIVTGASRGLGAAIAERFVQAGASVLLAAREESALRDVQRAFAAFAVRPGQRVEIFSGDVGQAEICDALVARAQELGPPLSILVNNAGVQGPIGALDEVDWDAWLDTIRINLLGVARMCRAVIPILRRAGGKIINLSGGGATGPRPRFSAYAVSKAAVVRLTETLAEELRGTGIDVNAVAPGAMNTRLLDEVLTAGPEKAGTQAYLQAVKQRDAGGASPDAAAALVEFLTSPASDGISGRLLSAVWDDWTRLADHREQLARSDVYTLRRIVPEDRGLSWKCA